MIPIKQGGFYPEWSVEVTFGINTLSLQISENQVSHGDVVQAAVSLRLILYWHRFHTVFDSLFCLKTAAKEMCKQMRHLPIYCTDWAPI